MKRRAPQRQAGFTLLEVLAAFVLFALAFGLVMQVLSASVRTTANAYESGQAAMWAQSVIDNVGLEIPVEETEESGRLDDDYSYTLSITPYELPEEDSLLQDVVVTELMLVDVTIEWGPLERPREARFSTLRTRPVTQR